MLFSDVAHTCLFPTRIPAYRGIAMNLELNRAELMIGLMLSKIRCYDAGVPQILFLDLMNRA
ncbi:hypothetical protein Gogos_003122 [Gossypium gossypioides]|uniref:Uncharacterized protein n=1 Tax=Gossypium gossypioides TaxID=34282 RepID=A0A7J9CLK4_GOSGO|nr:hypothetical protein [Gossypium gossypioides]